MSLGPWELPQGLLPDLLFGYTLTISGPNRNDVKEYMNDVFTTALDTIAPEMV